MNWPVLIIVGVLLVALVIFLVYRNQKDEVSMEEQLNQDYRKAKDEEADVESEEIAK